MALTAEQRRVLNAIKRGARRNRASPKELKAAIETGIVESNLRNLSGGDRDSAGWRQERASLYADPTNLDASVDRFFRETKAVKGKYGRAGDLAAAVQRPAAQYRGRYQQVSERADQLMGSGSRGPTIPGVSPRPQAMLVRGAGPSAADQRRQLLGQYLAVRGQPGALLGLGTGLANVQEPTMQRVLVPGSSAPATTLASSPRRSGTFKIVGPNPDRLKPQLVSFARRVAGIYGKPLVGSDGTGHSYRTATGGVSQHTTGNATDIPASGRELLRMGRAALIAAGMPRKQAMRAQGGLYNVNGHQIIFHDRKRVSGSPHDDHLHISAR